MTTRRKTNQFQVAAGSSPGAGSLGLGLWNVLPYRPRTNGQAVNGQRARPSITRAPGRLASSFAGRTSLECRTPLPITTYGVFATAASTSTGHPVGRPSGVIPPYSIPVSATAVSIGANEALRTSSSRRATLFTSALVVARIMHAAYLTSPSRLPEITTQLADSAGLTPYRSQNAAVSAAAGSISATPTSPAASSPSAASALATGAASRPALLSAGTAASEPM